MNSIRKSHLKDHWNNHLSLDIQVALELHNWAQQDNHSLMEIDKTLKYKDLKSLQYQISKLSLLEWIQ